MKTILIVDDDLRLREMLYEYLTRLGYKVFTAPGGKESVDMISQLSPDLVLMDLKMPGMNGIEVLDSLKGRGIKAKVVMLTGMDDVALEQEARLSGAAGFLQKQLELPVIAKSIEAMLREGEPADANAQRKILVVDDNEQILNLLDRFLRKKGYLPLLAKSGEDAFDVMRRSRPHAVLLDINLPGMDGLMTLKRIREINKEIGVIMITGLKDESIAEEAMNLGAFDYIVKPFDLDYLEMCLLTKLALLSV